MYLRGEACTETDIFVEKNVFWYTPNLCRTCFVTLCVTSIKYYDSPTFFQVHLNEYLHPIVQKSGFRGKIFACMTVCVCLRSCTLLKTQGMDRLKRNFAPKIIFRLDFRNFRF